MLTENARCALSTFGSTSPSYLILASLDKFNGSIPDFGSFSEKMARLRESLEDFGYRLVGDEPMKLTLDARAHGYLGYEMADELAARGVEVEFADPDFVVLMPSPMNSGMELMRLESALFSIPAREKIATRPPAFTLPERVLSPREAMLSARVTLPLSECVGQVLAAVTVGCPPAVPIAVAGEVISREVAAVFEYYGYTELTVVK